MNLRNVIESGFSWARESGFEIVKRQYRTYQDKCGCALQCAYWANGGLDDKPGLDDFADHLDIAPITLHSFISGFDDLGYDPNRDDLEAYLLGKEYGDLV